MTVPHDKLCLSTSPEFGDGNYHCDPKFLLVLMKKCLEILFQGTITQNSFFYYLGGVLEFELFLADSLLRNSI